MHATDIVGYTFNCEQYTPDAIVAVVSAALDIPVSENLQMTTEQALDFFARLAGVDRYDERSYDSGDFPKVIFASDVEDGEYFQDSDGTYVDMFGEPVGIWNANVDEWGDVAQPYSPFV